MSALVQPQRQDWLACAWPSPAGRLLRRRTGYCRQPVAEPADDNVDRAALDCPLEHETALVVQQTPPRVDRHHLRDEDDEPAVPVIVLDLAAVLAARRPERPVLTVQRDQRHVWLPLLPARPGVRGGGPRLGIGGTDGHGEDRGAQRKRRG